MIERGEGDRKQKDEIKKIERQIVNSYIEREDRERRKTQQETGAKIKREIGKSDRERGGRDRKLCKQKVRHEDSQRKKSYPNRKSPTEHENH